jgi:hypothetical protein
MKQLVLIGAIVMSTSSAQSLFEMPDEHILKLSPAMAVGVSNALQRFRATQQPLENFTVVVRDGEDKDVVRVSFVARLEPGKKGLGALTASGVG